MDSIEYNGKKYNLFEIEMYDKKYRIFFTEQKYMNNNSLAVQIMCVLEYGMDIFGMLTVNLSSPMQNENLAFIDSNNNSSWDWKEILTSNGIAKDTGVKQISGFCSYPLYKFDTSKFYSNE